MKRLLYSLTVMSVSLFFLCQASPGRVEAAESVKIGTSIRAFSVYVLTFSAGDENGIWKRHGVNVEWVPFKGGSAQYRAVAAGSLKLGLGPAVSEVRAIARRVPMVIVMNYQSLQEFFVWVQTGSRLRKPKDLRVAKIGVSRFGGAQHAYGLAAVKALGLEKQAKFIAVGGISSTLAALKTARIDAMVQPLEIMVKMKVKGEVRELLSVADHLPRPWPAHMLFAHKDLVKEDPGTIKKTVSALLDISGYIGKNPRWAVSKMEKVLGYPEGAAKLIYDNYRFSKDGRIDRRGLINVRDFLVEFGIVPKKKAPELNKIYTTEFTG
ncbi:MAG: ABC transporter substrate-binding protein [Thermodesulfobacteriota bacterium]